MIANGRNISLAVVTNSLLDRPGARAPRGLIAHSNYAWQSGHIGATQPQAAASPRPSSAPSSAGPNPYSFIFR